MVVNSKRNIRGRQAFSLIELVIVVVIIAIIGAIAIPRMSRGAAGASDSALTGDLNILRSAIDLYASEHNGTYPTLANITLQLTEFSQDDGTTSATKTSPAVYGPYLHAIPALPVGNNKGLTTFVDGSGSAVAGATAGGWFYDATTGNIHANLDATTYTDVKGVPYSTY